jgi:hypothetical protein
MVNRLAVSDLVVVSGIGVKMGSKVKKSQKKQGGWSNGGDSGVDF